MAYSINALTNDCYKGTTCLINKFDIKDEKILKELETTITLSKIAEYNLNPLFCTFDVSHYKAIHKFIFEDIYDWAGEYRTVNMTKKGTKFANSDDIEDLMERSFNRLKTLNYFQNSDFEVFVNNIVEFYCTTNMIHPFREGNGRTQRLFISQLIDMNGYYIDLFDIDTDELMIATIQAANGVKDYLIEIFTKAINKK